MSNQLETILCGIRMKNPVIAASGAFGFGDAYTAYFDPSRLGGIAGKGLTLHKSAGNKGVRVWETPAGMLNSIGLENPGVPAFVKTEAPRMRALGTAVLCNLGGHCENDYIEGARLLNDADIDLLELNISCPNLKAGGMAFGMEAQTAADITEKVKAVSRFPLVVKLTPNALELVRVAKACEEAGADGLSLVNTFLGMAVDTKKRKAVFDNVYAGLSGPCVQPVALRMVHQVCKAVSIPVLGMGGICDWQSALAFLMAGATAVQVGASTFADPMTMPRIIEGLQAYCEEEGLQNISEIRGCV